MQKVALALDIGGTFIKAACVNRIGKILFEESFSSASHLKPALFVAHLCHIIQILEKKSLEQKMQILGLGIGVPGIVNSQKGIVYESPHFPHWKNFKIKAALQKKIKIPIYLDNDANRAALGEAWLGRGKSLQNFIFLTLGTGIGSGIILNKQIWQGDSGFAGELGHLVIEREGRKCPCGGRGCLERYASQVGLEEEWKLRSQEKFPGPEKLYFLAQKKNKIALEIWKAFGFSLGCGLASLMNILGIENILLGGGISSAFDFFKEGMHQGMEKHLYKTSLKKMRIKKALLKNKAGVLGCASPFFKKS